jgi:hypothetical protein
VRALGCGPGWPIVCRRPCSMAFCTAAGVVLPAPGARIPRRAELPVCHHFLTNRFVYATPSRLSESRVEFGSAADAIVSRDDRRRTNAATRRRLDLLLEYACTGHEDRVAHSHGNQKRSAAAPTAGRCARRASSL